MCLLVHVGVAVASYSPNQVQPTNQIGSFVSHDWISKTGGSAIQRHSALIVLRFLGTVLSLCSNAAMSSVIDTNLPPVGRDQGTKRKPVAPPEGGKENHVGPSSRAKPNKRVKVTEPTEQVST